MFLLAQVVMGPIAPVGRKPTGHGTGWFEPGEAAIRRGVASLACYWEENCGFVSTGRTVLFPPALFFAASRLVDVATQTHPTGRGPWAYSLVPPLVPPPSQHRRDRLTEAIHVTFRHAGNVDSPGTYHVDGVRFAQRIDLFGG